MKNTILLLFVCLHSAAVVAQSSSIQWEKSFGGTMYDYAKEIEHTADGGYITAGYTGSADGIVSFNHGGGDCWIVKSNSAGVVQWEKTFGGTGYDYGYSIKQTADGGYIAAGYTESADGDVAMNHGGGDCWVLKLNSSGAVEWEKTYGGTSTDLAQCIRPTTDGGYIITGYTESADDDVTGNHGGGDCWVLKINDTGIKEWQKTLGGSSYDFGQDIKQTPDDGYILTGGTRSSDGDVTGQHGNGDCWIVKLNSAGIITWQSSLGGTNYDYGQSVELTSDGGYITAGYSESADGNVAGSHGGGDCWVVKCDNAGNPEWQKALGSTGNDYAYCIQQITGSGYILTGYSELNDGDVSGNHGNYDCWIVELDELGEVTLQRSFGGNGVDIGYSIRETAPGNYIIAGYSESNDGDITGSYGSGDCWIIKLNISTLGTNENDLNEIVSVSPNPSTGYFKFSGLTEESNIEIFDVSGQAVVEIKSADSRSTVDLSSQAKGIYFYRIRMRTGESKTGKIILD